MDRREFIGATAGAVAAMQLPATADEPAPQPFPGRTLLEHVLAGTDPTSSLSVAFTTSAGTLWSTGKNRTAIAQRAYRCHFKEIQIVADIEVYGLQIFDGAGRLVGKELYGTPKTVKVGEELNAQFVISVAR